jgi:lysine 2,3-aminomutase
VIESTGGTAPAVIRPPQREAEEPFVNRRDPAQALGPDGRPAVSRRAPVWADVPDEKWNDWRWQLSNRVNELHEIERILELTDEERDGLSAPEKFRVDVTPYFISLIDPDDPNDPIRRQVIPLGREQQAFTAMMEDSLAEDRHSPVPGLVHRYPDRVLMLITTQCASYCRYCTRSRIVGDPTQNFNRKDHEAQLDYLRRTPQVRDVLISGGDGLTLAPKLLESVMRGLREIPHIEIVRIGSRVPVFLPQRVDDDLCEMLAKYHPIWMNLHFNHPNEITPEVSRAVDRLTRAGIPVGNQSVLLAGVNDCVHIQRSLVHKLVENRIRPYYLYQCDLVEGSGHFRTPVGKGLEIIEGLRGHTSGYAVPTYVVDAPGGGGKIPVMPNYLISYSDHKVVLRNYEGYITTYEEPSTYQRHDPSTCSFCRSQRSEPGQSGVHGLLQGDRMWIEPKGFDEVHSRGNVEAHRLQRPDKWVPYGVGAIEGATARSLAVLEPGTMASAAPAGGLEAITNDSLLPSERAASDVNAGIVQENDLVPEEHRRVYGPGEEPRPPEGAPQATAHGELL